MPAGCCCCCCWWGQPAATASCLALPAAGWEVVVFTIEHQTIFTGIDSAIDALAWLGLFFQSLGIMLMFLWNRTVQHAHNNVHKVKRSFHVAADSLESVCESSSGCSQLLSLQFLLMINFNVRHDGTDSSRETLRQLHLRNSKLLRQPWEEAKAKLAFSLTSRFHYPAVPYVALLHCRYLSVHSNH